MSHPLAMIDSTEAVRRMANSEYHSGSREPSAVKSRLRRLAKRIDDPDLTAIDERGRRKFHPSIHPALSELPVKDRIGKVIHSLPQHKRKRALAKLTVLRAFKAFCRGEGRGLGKTQARLRFIEKMGGRIAYWDGQREHHLNLSRRSLERWENEYATGGIDALAQDGRGGGRVADLDPEAVVDYWARRNDRRKFSIADCYRFVAREAREKGWKWHDEYKTCFAWDRRERPKRARALVLNREGEKRYTQKCRSYIEPELDSFAPGECSVGDDVTLNVWVKTPAGKAIRPTLSVWQDWHSRYIGGFRMVPTGNEHSLLLAFGDLAASCGLPGTVIADNGKNYSSWQWRGNAPKRRAYRQAGELADQVEGLFALLGITPSWCLPYNPNGKARLERWFRTLDEQFCKQFASYCGRTPEDRPDAHAKLIRRAVPWETFVAKLKDYVAVYNARPHSGEGMDGRTPQQVMALAPRKRVLDDNVRPLLLAAWHRPVSVGRNGVAVRICGATVRYGADEPALRALAIGTKIRVAYDPEDVGSITVWTMDYRFVCSAAMNQRLNRKLPSEALRETMRQRGHEKRVLREAGKIGLEHLRDPVDRSIAALAQDGQRRRRPDPTDPDGTPILVPVQAPIEAVPVEQRRRKAVGAEEPDIYARLDDFTKKPSTDSRRRAVVDPLLTYGKSDGA